MRFGTVWFPVLCNHDPMSDKHCPDATLSSVAKEVAKPRLAASVQGHCGEHMTAPAKFGIGVQVHNPNTKEDGLVRKVYQADSGETMYEVAVPAGPHTWAGIHYVSDWAESNLKLSGSATLKTVDKPTGSTYL